MRWIWTSALVLAACGPEEVGPAALEDTGVEALPWLAPLDRGHFEAGVETFDFVDARGKELTIEVWYPSAPDEGAEPDPYPEVPIVKESYRKASPDHRGGPYPLVAFSHGFAGIRYQSVFLTEHLARHGYVVVAPDHPHNTFLDIDEYLTGPVAVERPGDIISSVDEVIRLSDEGHARLGGMVNGDHYVVMGHSFGSITSLAVGGGDFDIAGLMEACAENRTRPCGFLDSVDPDELVIPDEVADPRVVGTIPMSPGLWYAFQPDGSGIADVAGPMVLGGDNDSLMNLETEIMPVYDNASPRKGVGILAGGGHYAFSDICEIAPFFDDCGGPADGFIEVEEGHRITNHLVTAWLGLVLRQDEAYADELDADSLSEFPELSWTDDGVTD